jgi:hypothetical protein
MLVAIHQPCFLPWLGYLDRMMRSDLFVVLDHVQFERRNYQNRTLIRNEGEAKWLTVPVVQVSQKETILEKRVDNPAETPRGGRWWGPSIFSTMKYAYRKSPHFARYAPKLEELLNTRWEKLVDLDLAMLGFLREELGITTKLARSSELAVTGAKSELLLNICLATGASAFFGGLGGSRTYLDQAAFDAAGMGVVWQEFSHPEYAQCGPEPFIKGLSAVDILFNCGPAARDIVWKSHLGERELLAA